MVAVHALVNVIVVTIFVIVTVIVIATILLHSEASVADAVPVVNRQSGTTGADHVELTARFIEPGAAAHLVTAAGEIFAHSHDRVSKGVVDPTLR